MNAAADLLDLPFATGQGALLVEAVQRKEDL
jgi:hypothetical protein